MMIFNKRRIVAAKLQGVILPSVIKELNAKSRNIGKMTINKGGDMYAKVSGIVLGGNA
jgi:hypothetical protein